jgi:hypothetical protein
LMPRVREAHRAIQIARCVDLNDPETRVLLVVRTQAAIQRAAVDHFGLGLKRDGARLVEPHRAEIHLRVAVEQRLELPVIAAALAQVHLVVANTHLCVDHGLAHRTDALRLLQEHLVPIETLRPCVHRRRHAVAPSCSGCHCNPSRTTILVLGHVTRPQPRPTLATRGGAWSAMPSVRAGGSLVLGESAGQGPIPSGAPESPSSRARRSILRRRRAAR